MMKYNLKNRPKFILGGQRDYEEWFEQFEAELRAMNQDTMNGGTKHRKWFLFIEEILGE